MAMNVGFGATVTTYAPKGRTLEATLGLSETDPLEEVAASTVPLGRWLPYVPPYGDLAVLESVSRGEKSAPSIAPGVALAAGTAASQALLNLLHPGNNRPKPVYAPRVVVIDAMSITAKVVRYPRLGYQRHLGVVVLKNLLGRAPKAGY